MRKTMQKLAMASLMATGAFMMVTLTPAIAQTTKPAPPIKGAPPTKDTTAGKDTPATKAPAVKGSVVVKKDKAGKHRFYVEDEGGKVLAMSTVGYEKVEDAMKMIDNVKSILNTTKPTEEKAK